MFCNGRSEPGKCCWDRVSTEPGSQLEHIDAELCKYPHQPVPAGRLAQICPICSPSFSKSVGFLEAVFQIKCLLKCRSGRLVLLEAIREILAVGSAHILLWRALNVIRKFEAG